MRDVLARVVLLALLLAGCLSPAREPALTLEGRPGAPFADAGWTDAPIAFPLSRGWNETSGAPAPTSGSWQARFTPGNLTGLPGETARVLVELSTPRADDARIRVQAPEWARMVGANETIELGPEGGAFELDVLVGPIAQLNLTAQIVEGECCGLGFFEGPRVGLSSQPSLAVTELTHALAPRAPAGLSVDAASGRVDATWTYPELGADCSQIAQALGMPIVRDIEGRRTLLLFVHAWSSDACLAGAGPGPRPQVRASAIGLEPGEIDVHVFLSHTGMILPSGWVDLTRTVMVPP